MEVAFFRTPIAPPEIFADKKTPAIGRGVPINRRRPLRADANLLNYSGEYHRNLVLCDGKR